MKRYYIATSLENAAEHNRVRDFLNLCGFEITYDWTSHGSVRHEGVGRLSEVSVNESQGVSNADFVIVLMPGGRGTHVELGVALARGIRVYLVGDHEDFHTASPNTCAFYHHPVVQHLKTTEELAWRIMADLISKYR